MPVRGRHPRAVGGARARARPHLRQVRAEFRVRRHAGRGHFRELRGRRSLECDTSANGRRGGMPVASDMSPVPTPQDLPPAPSHGDIYKVMDSYKVDTVEVGISNVAPVDMNILAGLPMGARRGVRRGGRRGQPDHPNLC